MIGLAGGGTYFNTGTWADVMRVPRFVYATDEDRSEQALRKFVHEIAQNKLDRYREFSPTYVKFSIGADGRAEGAALRRVGLAR